ncbi:hypothetical protein MUK42_27135 [Musa troglodytarum]|uniref:Uncharacterized protein n=1 Tax=Musa troglodytarum TaxID=320322 RepID=A0A9E7K3Y8_9LILI|nr:hypothetical protein MUK42_27135 [Musa troglodytarum]
MHLIFTLFFFFFFFFSAQVTDTYQDSAMRKDHLAWIPSAVLIHDGSPPAEDGLQLGCEIVKFENAERGGELQSRLQSRITAVMGLPFSDPTNVFL